MLVCQWVLWQVFNNITNSFSPRRVPYSKAGSDTVHKVVFCFGVLISAHAPGEGFETAIAARRNSIGLHVNWGRLIWQLATGTNLTDVYTLWTGSKEILLLHRPLSLLEHTVESRIVVVVAWNDLRAGCLVSDLYRIWEKHTKASVVVCHRRRRLSWFRVQPR